MRYAQPPFWRKPLRASNSARSCSESPAGAGCAAGDRFSCVGREDRRQVGVDAEQSLRRLPGHHLDEAASPISALRDVVRVAQSLHEHVPGTADALQPPSDLCRSRREAEARQGRDDKVEGVLRLTAERGGIGERADDLDLLEDRARPPVRDDQRQRIGMAGLDVDVVDVDAVDGRHELRDGVQLRLGLPPVVVRAPVPDELLELGQPGTLRAIRNRLPVRPPRGGDAPAEVDQVRFRHVDAEGANGCGVCSVVDGNSHVGLLVLLGGRPGETAERGTAAAC